MPVRSNEVAGKSGMANEIRAKDVDDGASQLCHHFESKDFEQFREMLKSGKREFNGITVWLESDEPSTVRAIDEANADIDAPGPKPDKKWKPLDV